MVPRETSYGPEHFFDLTDVWFSNIFNELKYPWELLAPGRKEAWIRSVIRGNVSKAERRGTLVLAAFETQASGGKGLVEAGAYLSGEEIELRAGALIEAGAWVAGPTILGEGTIVRHGAYLRGGVITGRKAILGHASEVKSSIFLNSAKAPHFAYVGDSILGNHTNLGAGTKISNLKITGDEVILNVDEMKISTGMKKFGAIVGDNCETGCNSVLNPGVLLGKGCLVYPAIAVRKNYYKPGSRIRGAERRR